MNVCGGDLEPCSFDPVTGLYRDGCCRTGSGDLGVHVVCAVMTEEFLESLACAGTISLRGRYLRISVARNP